MKAHIPKLLLLTVLVIAGCKPTQQDVIEEIGYGELNGNTYTNAYFGLKIDFPEGWHPLDRAAMTEAQNMGRELVVGENKQLDRAMSAAEHNTLTLFMVHQHPPDAPVPSNPGITCVVEKVAHLPQIKTGQEYLNHTKRVLQQSQVSYSFPQPMYKKKIDGAIFDVMPGEMDLGGFIVKQKLLAVYRKDYIFMLGLSYSTPEEEKLLLDMLTTMKID